jgi:hypothetical protein
MKKIIISESQYEKLLADKKKPETTNTKVIKLSEGDLSNIVKKVMVEQNETDDNLKDQLNRIGNSILMMLNNIGNLKNSDSIRKKNADMLLDYFSSNGVIKIDDSRYPETNMGTREGSTTKINVFIQNSLKRDPQGVSWKYKAVPNSVVAADKSEWENNQQLNTNTGEYENTSTPKIQSISVEAYSVRGEKKEQKSKTDTNTVKKVKWQNMEVPSVEGSNFNEAFKNAGKIKSQLPVWDKKNKPVFMWNGKPYIYETK